MQRLCLHARWQLDLRPRAVRAVRPQGEAARLDLRRPALYVTVTGPRQPCVRVTPPGSVTVPVVVNVNGACLMRFGLVVAVIFAGLNFGTTTVRIVEALRPPLSIATATSVSLPRSESTGRYAHVYGAVVVMHSVRSPL